MHRVNTTQSSLDKGASSKRCVCTIPNFWPQQTIHEMETLGHFYETDLTL
jgi:hypothetical protein